ncbi:hypothetical protein HIM_08669 [Hirsutella minnesotensis 3608]|uniref:Glycosyl transferase n=1 Tax=Hirsutella minnesotensis 3608 TaxID=1043627 RepID=A0A0F7ZST3_9HYPO|nr:hypothetical protein HIM_08669 [Hirsutella minnesotensis 3608]
MARFSFNVVALSAILSLSILLLSFRQVRPRFTKPHSFRESPQQSQHHEEDGIPNQVHFVYLVKDASANISFQFSHYLAMYAAWHHWQPTAIFLHTNAGDEAISRARSGHSSKWDRQVFEMPGLVVNHVSVPHRTNTGKKLRYAEHSSDFVRVQAVRDLGGVYVDFDAFALRDIKVLRRSGFNAVAGREVTGQINSGIFMSKKDGAVVRTWAEEMHKVYDGYWVTHSNLALTRIAEDAVAEPGEMLIMERNALAPGGWGPLEYNSLWEAHDDVPSNLQHVNQGDRLPAVSSIGPPWVTNWSKTYILHAFMPYRANFTVKGFDYISPRYVLERRSNFARALYPLVKIMYEEGLVTIDDAFHGYLSLPNKTIPNMPVPIEPIAPKPGLNLTSPSPRPLSSGSFTLSPPSSASPPSAPPGSSPLSLAQLEASVSASSLSSLASQSATPRPSLDDATPSRSSPYKPGPEQSSLALNTHTF